MQPASTGSRAGSEKKVVFGFANEEKKALPLPPASIGSQPAARKSSKKKFSTSLAKRKKRLTFATRFNRKRFELNKPNPLRKKTSKPDLESSRKVTYLCIPLQTEGENKSGRRKRKLQNYFAFRLSLQKRYLPLHPASNGSRETK
ncbi:hypothetical protein [Hymenobacter sp. DG25B]|uniref:hypothetical protein n=1 Tax=Hymenobacter sp. DG25B TaxID=1385664 RepID=UPI0012E042B3|nr:hypothetical protein [Hymenobacter sp. DG25B]